MLPGSAKRPGAYPLMLDTSNSGKPEHNTPSSASPGGSSVDRSRFPPGPLEAGKSIGSKRPANSPINSTIDKRPRMNRATEKDRSASRGSPAATKYGAISTATDIAPSRRSSAENIINASRDPRKQGRGPAHSASPIRTASPFALSNSEAAQQGSGRTTPVSGAPVAPPMIPSTVPFPPKRASGNELRCGVASIRLAAAKKQILTAPASENAAIAQLRAKMIDSQNQNKRDLEHLKSDLANETSLRHQTERRLDEKLEKSQTTPVDPNLVKKVSELSEKVQQLQASHDGSLEDVAYIDALVSRVKQSMPSPPPPKLDVAVVKSDLEKRLQQLETALESGLGKRLQKLETAVDSDLGKRLQKLEAAMNDMDFSKRLQKIETGVKSYSKQVNEFEADLITLKQSELPTLNKSRIDSLCEKMNDLETLPMQLADMRKDLFNQIEDQKMNTGQDFESVERKLSEKLNAEQLEAMNSKLDAAKDEIKNHLKEQFTAFSEQLTAVTDKTKADVRKDLSEIHKITQERAKYAQEHLDGLQTSLDTLAKRQNSTSSAQEHDVEQLQDRIKDLEDSTSSSISQLRADLSDHQTTIASRVDPEIDRMQVRLRSRTPVVQNMTQQPDYLKNKIDGMAEDLEELTKEVDKVSITAEIARNMATATSRTLVSEVENKFGPQLLAIKKDIESVRAEKEILRRTESAEQHQSHVPRNESGSVHSMAHDTRVTTIEKQLESLKQETEQRVKLLTSTQQHIEDRMQNLTTDEQYLRMLHWMVSTYPNAPGFLDQLHHLKKEVHDVAKAFKELEWLRGHERRTQMVHLAELAESLSQSLGGAQGSSFQTLRDLVVNNQALQQQIAVLRTEFKAENDSQQTLIKSIDSTSAIARHSQNRVHALEEQVNTLIQSGNSDFAERALRQLQGRVDAMESASKDHGMVLTEQQRITSQMRLRVSVLMMAAYEHQEAIYAVNNNLRGGGLSLRFSHEFSNNNNNNNQNNNNNNINIDGNNNNDNS